MASYIQTTISGIPCRAVVDTYHVTKGTYSRQAETPDEYYGASEIEFTICDRKGYDAPWLTRKMTSDDVSRIEQEIIDAHDRRDH